MVTTIELQSRNWQVRFSQQNMSASTTPILDLAALPPPRRTEVLPRVLGFVVGVVGTLGAMKLFYEDSVPGAGLVVFLLALAAAVIVHELGHLIAGWTVGFHFSSIQIGWFFVGFEYGKLTFKTKRQFNLAGYTTVQIDRIRRLRRRLFIVVLGGPAANLFGALVGASVISAFDLGDSALAGFARVFALICLVLTVTNLIPFSTRGIRTDGARVVMLLSSKDKTRRLICLMAIARQQKDGKRAKSWNGNWTRAAASIRDGSFDEYASCWISYICASERKDVEVAASYLERCLEMSSMIPGFLRDLLFLEASIFHAWFRRDAIKAGKWALQVRNRDAFPKLLWLRGLIALSYARGDFSLAYAEWSEAKKIVEHLPKTKFRDAMLDSFHEWLAEIQQREAETAQVTTQIAGR